MCILFYFCFCKNICLFPFFIAGNESLFYYLVFGIRIKKQRRHKFRKTSIG